MKPYDSGAGGGLQTGRRSVKPSIEGTCIPLLRKLWSVFLICFFYVLALCPLQPADQPLCRLRSRLLRREVDEILIPLVIRTEACLQKGCRTAGGCPLGLRKHGIPHVTIQAGKLFPHTLVPFRGPHRLRVGKLGEKSLAKCLGRFELRSSTFVLARRETASLVLVS
jgi:hypothetical protein